VVSDVRDSADDGESPEFAAEPADGDGDDVGEGVGVLVPCLLQEVLGGKDGRVRSHEGLQDREFPG
jgi:hypothetical protein